MSATSIYVSEQVRQIQCLYADLCPPSWVIRPIREHLEDLARRLSEGHSHGGPAAAIVLRNWLERLVGAAGDVILKSNVTPEKSAARRGP